MSIKLEYIVVILVVVAGIVAGFLTWPSLVQSTTTNEATEAVLETAFQKEDISDWSWHEFQAWDSAKVEQREKKLLQDAAETEQLTIDRGKTGSELFWEPSDKFVGKVKVSSAPFPADMVRENPWLIVTTTGLTDFVRVSYRDRDNIQKDKEVYLYQKSNGLHYATLEEIVNTNVIVAQN